ncbi:hypothetical protein B0H11DRAFT_2183616 [Mycena galericulata]|nr:hypothetical protein B0H11DRAFT_2183616 [Mycena galericulata]
MDNIESSAKLTRGLALLDNFSDLEGANDAASALKMIVDACSSDPSLSIDGRYSSKDCCLRLLQREAGLHEMLRRCHATKDYENVKNSKLIQKRKMPRAAQELLEEIRPLLTEFIKSKQPLTSWTPPLKPLDSNTADHLASLKILALRKQGPPLVILKDLGSFAEDPILESRVKNIFVKGKRTVLVNTSGSGKTRLLFEGLCREWGLYFTSRLDTSNLGSYDLHRILNETLRMDSKFSEAPLVGSSNFAENLEYNRLQAYRRVSETLLARLLIFHMFLEIVTGLGRAQEHKITWLILQLHCVLGSYLDIFDDLTTALEEPMDVYTWANISDTFCDIHKMLGPDPHLFFVLDEAQSAADRFPRAFHPDPGVSPILLEILQTWKSHSLEGAASFVIAGTEIPPRIFAREEDTEALRWTSDTGAFDEKPLQEKYLRGFLPTTYLASETGQEFLQRAWQWARGRHRYTASLVENLLVSGLQSPHRLLDKYVQSLSGFKPSDRREVVAKEPLVNFGRLDLNPMDYSRLESLSNVRTKYLIQDVLFHYLAIGPRSWGFAADEVEAVSLDYGRFTYEDMREVLVDEPIVLAGAAMWMTRPPPKATGISRRPPVPSHTYLTALQRDPPHTAETFAKCLAFYFSRAFVSKPAVSDLLTFPKPLPAWAKQSAELVELHANEDGDINYSVISESDVVGPLATSAHYLKAIVSWMEHKDRTAFCLPAARNPDLLFAMRLANGSFIWVVVQATPSASDGNDLLACLEEEQLFRDEEHDPDFSAHNRAIQLLNTPPTGSGTATSAAPTVLRVVVSFEDQLFLKKAAKKAAPQASLSMEMFRELTAAISPSEIVETMVASFLGKRKESPEKRKESPEAGNDQGRAKKRQNSLPVSGDESIKAEKGKNKMPPSTRELRSSMPREAPVPEASTRELRPRPTNKDAPKDAPKEREGKARAVSR